MTYTQQLECFIQDRLENYPMPNEVIEVLEIIMVNYEETGNDEYDQIQLVEFKRLVDSTIGIDKLNRLSI